MNFDQMPHNSFSMIADFDGDIRELLSKEINDRLPVLPLRNMVLFPGIIAPITVGRESSLQLIKQVLKKGEDAYIAVGTQVDERIEQPTLNDIYPTGVLARVVRVFELPGQPMTAILQTFGRVGISTENTRSYNYLRAQVYTIPEELPAEDDAEFTALFEVLKKEVFQLIKRSEEMGQEAMMSIQNISNPIFFIHFIATNLPISPEEKALLLEVNNLKERTHKLLEIVQRELQLTLLKHRIKESTQHELDQQQKEYFLQQLQKKIQSELGNDEETEIQQFKDRAEVLELSKEARTAFDRELGKLSKLSPHSPDYHVAYNYLETILTLPWGEKTADQIDIKRAQRTLDADHYGMERVKERILEHLAMMKVRKSRKASIICLHGPPGVGKTSLCKSIAESLGKNYVRMSLGGLHDESEIRGHRRTYVGAMCGRVMKNIIKAKSNNPVFVLDEIDKIGGGSRNGDPQSALLELLDPEQNNAFHDNFLDFDYDLSDVFFIATANYVGNIPAPLRDRMEMIEVEGYLTEEKKEIAKRHLIPKEIQALDLPFKVKLSPAATEFIIEKYTRESGVRQLSKQIAKLVRKIVLHSEQLDEGAENPYAKALKPQEVQKLLGTIPYNRDSYQGNDHAGVVTGLAWTSVGGEILFIESSLSPAKAPRLNVTGNLGEVMKESTMLAMEYVKAHTQSLDIDQRIFDKWSIHVHFPEGATPKDGPSAGITIATALASLLTQRKVRARIAMTGEITLRGKVLPVGGIKEKILAAKRAGITDILLSRHNEKDVKDIPERYVEGLTFHFVDTVEEVWNFALLKEKVKNPLTFTFEEQDKPQTLEKTSA